MLTYLILNLHEKYKGYGLFIKNNSMILSIQPFLVYLKVQFTQNLHTCDTGFLIKSN